MNRTRRSLAAAALGVVLALTTSAAALANVPDGWRYEYKGPVSGSNKAYSYQQWTPGSVQNQRAASSGVTLAAGYCVDSWFDWTRLSGEGNRLHYDARFVRQCQSGTVRDTWYNDGTGAGLKGMQKAAGCYGPNNNTVNPTSKCALAANSIGDFGSSNPLFGDSNKCARQWIRYPNGNLDYRSGGISTDCNA